MFPIPTVPTESLYKFMALGGVICIITTLLLFVTERQKIEIENIKLNSSIAAYDSKIKFFDQELQEAQDKFIHDSTDLGKKFAYLNSLRNSKSKKLADSVFVMNGKKYNLEAYQYALDRAYAKSAKTVNVSIVARNKAVSSAEFERIKLVEQNALVNLNSNYFNLISVLTASLVIGGIICSRYGFVHWHKMQIISDEITRLQFEKALKEQAQPTEEIT